MPQPTAKAPGSETAQGSDREVSSIRGGRQSGSFPRAAVYETGDDQQEDDRSTPATSEKLSGQFGIGDFVPSDLVEIARDVALRAAKQPLPL
jgi:hypothetical protein